MRLRAKPRTTPGKVKQILWSEDRVKPIEVPTFLEIVSDEDAWHLVHLGPDGRSLADTWHASLDEAKNQAEFEFGVIGEDWKPID